MINYPLYDACTQKNRLHKRATHTSAKSSPKARVYDRTYSLYFILHALNWNAHCSL